MSICRTDVEPKTDLQIMDNQILWCHFESYLRTPFFSLNTLTPPKDSSIGSSPTSIITQTTAAIEACAPTFVEKGWIGDHVIKYFERIALLEFWIGQGVTLHD